MKVTISPETELEKKNFKVIEHEGVNEFMIFGNKKDHDGHLIDFHEWSGQYRYLIGGIHYFAEVINDERKERVRMVREQEANRPQAPQMSVMPSAPTPVPMPTPPMPSPSPNLKVVSMENVETPNDIPKTEAELEAKVEAVQEDLNNF